MKAKLIKSIAMPEYEISLYRTENKKYQINYKILGQEFFGEEINHIEFVDVLFDMKLKELDNATSTPPSIS